MATDSRRPTMDEQVLGNRRAWEDASTKHVRENDRLLEQARAGTSLTRRERALLAPVLATRPTVVHLQSGHGVDDPPMITVGARTVLGVDFSAVAVAAAQGRADALAVPCHYVVSEVPRTPLADRCADLVYTGKGALIWMQDLAAWAREVARLLRPGGELFVYEAHPAVPLWSWDEDVPRIRADRSYFAPTNVNDTFPARGAVEWQYTLGDIVTTVVAAGLQVRHLAEYPDPFWYPGDVDAAAWSGRLPNAFSLLARRAS